MLAKPRPKLLVLSSTYPRWASDPEPGFVHELSRRLTTDFEVRVLCPHALGAKQRETLDGVEVLRYQYAPTRFETLVNNGGIVANLKRTPWKWLLVPLFISAQIFSVWRQVLKWRPDVIHAHWIVPQGLVAALLQPITRRPLPLLVTSHGADLYALRGKIPVMFKRFVVKRAASMTVVSVVMRDELVQLGGNAEKISVQPMGVDLQQRFIPSQSVIRSRFELLFVGRLVEKKGLKFLLDAMPAILAKHPDVFLTVAGFGPEEPMLRQQVDRLNLNSKVHFLGAVLQSQLPALYRRAALFVAPFVTAASGDQEGLGLVVVEATGCECPVLVSDLPAIRDVVPPGLQRVVPGDSAALAQSVSTLLACTPESREKIAKTLRHSLVERMDWSAVALGYSHLLKGARISAKSHS